MLILPSQLWDGHPEVLYVGLRPNPSISAVPLRAANNSFGALKNVTVTFSYGASFTASGFAIVHWAVVRSRLEPAAFVTRTRSGAGLCARVTLRGVCDQVCARGSSLAPKQAPDNAAASSSAESA